MFLLSLVTILMTGRSAFCINGGTDGNMGIFQAFGYISELEVNEPICGATLITNHHIITIAPCLHNWRTKMVQFGVKDWCKKDSEASIVQWSTFRNVYVENYNNPDCALAIGSLTITIRNIVPIVPPSYEGLTGYESYGICGFGVFDNSNLKSCTFRQAELMVTPQHQACPPMSGLICSEPKIHSPQAGSMCDYDQGGPLVMCVNDGPYPHCYLTGIQWKTLDGSCTGTNLARCVQDPEASEWINNIIDYSQEY